jgi:HK97 family phage prohead protease
MSETLRKFIEPEIKILSDEERTLWAVASTEDRDRDGDIIVQKGWKLQNYKKNPVILWAHNPTRPPIGKAVDMKVEDAKLKIKIQFVPEDVDPFAEQIFQLYKQGFMKTFSVGFIPYKAEPLTEEDKKQRPDMTWGRRLFAELLELSAVPVPSNPMALAQREFADAMVKGYSSATETPAPAAPPLEMDYRNEDDTLNERKLRAWTAAVYGARGGLPISKEERDACLKHLQGVWNGTPFKAFELHEGMTQEELRKEFADVWGDELLDIVSDAKEPEVPEPAEPAVSEETLKALSDLNTTLSAVDALLKK